jgi:hypothetical protein
VPLAITMLAVGSLSNGLSGAVQWLSGQCGASTRGCRRSSVMVEVEARLPATARRGSDDLPRCRSLVEAGGGNSRLSPLSPRSQQSICCASLRASLHSLRKLAMSHSQSGPPAGCSTHQGLAGIACLQHGMACRKDSIQKLYHAIP